MEKRVTTFKKKSLQNFSSSITTEEYEMTRLLLVEKKIVKECYTRKNTKALDMILPRRFIFDC